MIVKYHRFKFVKLLLKNFYLCMNLFFLIFLEKKSNYLLEKRVNKQPVSKNFLGETFSKRAVLKESNFVLQQELLAR